MASIDENIKRYEALLKSVQRDGIQKLMNYIKNSTDFYKALLPLAFSSPVTAVLYSIA